MVENLLADLAQGIINGAVAAVAAIWLDRRYNRPKSLPVPPFVPTPQIEPQGDNGPHSTAHVLQRFGLIDWNTASDDWLANIMDKARCCNGTSLLPYTDICIVCAHQVTCENYVPNECRSVV